ncbi:MAG TPA: PsbP-related protein, partial [Candidatus Kapabacteria bacterium]|nr:PsbP-related protein [Candidatus Kapabacteria bacterium]
KTWSAESTPGNKTTYYSTPSTETRFQNFTEGDMGARIEVGAIEHSSKEKAANDFKQSMENVAFTGPVPDSLGGMPALKVSYSISGDENGLTGYRIFTDKDSLVTYFDAATFGAQRMTKYAPIFDLARQSVQPAFVLKITNGKYDSASMATMMQQMEPSSTFSTYSGSGFSIQYPDNFSASPMSGGVEIKGERADAMVRVDANTVQKGIDLDKYVAENAQKTYHGATASNTSIGGQTAKMISYGSAGATARAYFVMSGQTIYRVTVSWPNSLESAFRPALEKSVQSFKAK